MLMTINSVVKLNFNQRAKLPTPHTRRLQAIATIMYKVKMVWRLLTLRNHLLLPILSITLEILISPYPDFGLLLMANIA